MGTALRTVKGLFPRLVDPAHLARACRLTTRGKRRRPDVAWFLFREEAELARIGAALRDGRWRPSPFDVLRIRDPKPRAIARTLIEDRVVHAALALLLEEAWAPRLLPSNMACRRGFGTHRARLALQRLLRRHRFAVHLDIRAYFPSIELDGLRAVLARRIRDARFLAVLDHVLVSGQGLIDRPGLRGFLGLGEDWPPPARGLPVGAYTSQVLATHVCLDALDHHLERDLRVPGYVRYVDDLFLFGDRRADLRAWRSAVGAWLREERSLRLKHPDARVFSAAGTLHGLGAYVRRDGITLDGGAHKRLARRVRERAGGRMDAAAFARSVMASVSAGG